MPEPIKVPLWVMEQSFRAYGSKQPPHPGTMRDDIKECDECHKVMWRAVDENRFFQQILCDDCVKVARENDRKKYGRDSRPWGRESGIESTIWRGYGDDGFKTEEEIEQEKVKAAMRDIPAGNLKEAEYRFWIGNMSQLSNTAICRACREELYTGENGRNLHKLKVDLWKNNTPCTVALVDCYNRMLRIHKCIVCREDCGNNSRWGVPLCSPKCVKKWKFENNFWISLDMELRQEWAKPDHVAPVIIFPGD
jgi:hypothetical protein